MMFRSSAVREQDNYSRDVTLLVLTRRTGGAAKVFGSIVGPSVWSVIAFTSAFLNELVARGAATGHLWRNDHGTAARSVSAVMGSRDAHGLVSDQASSQTGGRWRSMDAEAGLTRTQRSPAQHSHSGAGEPGSPKLTLLIVDGVRRSFGGTRPSTAITWSPARSTPRDRPNAPADHSSTCYGVRQARSRDGSRRQVMSGIAAHEARGWNGQPSSGQGSHEDSVIANMSSARPQSGRALWKGCSVHLAASGARDEAVPRVLARFRLDHMRDEYDGTCREAAQLLELSRGSEAPKLVLLDEPRRASTRRDAS